MPIAFSSLPLHNQIHVVEKMNIKAVAAFHKTSEAFQTTVQLAKKPFAPLAVDSANISYKNEDLLVRFRQKTSSKIADFPLLRFSAKEVQIEGDLVEDFCSKFLEFVRDSRSKFRKLKLVILNDSCSSSTFRHLLQTAEVKKLNMLYSAPQFTRNLPQNVQKLNAQSYLHDDDLMEIGAPDVHLIDTSVGNSGINKALKDWVEGKRKIDHYFIHTENDLEEEEVLKEIAFSTTDDPSLFKLDNGKETIYVFITNIEGGIFEAATFKSEISFVRS